ncbi:MAG TPA: hypothetical protein P5040_05360 [Smithella sp.]|nr:hypothetical protein [Smithella sp.]
MEKNTLLKSMIHLQKTYFDNYFSMITKLHEQAENILKNWAEQTPYTSEEGKKAMENWRTIYKKQCEDFRKAVDSGYSKMESFFDDDSMIRFQQQTEKMFNQFLRQSAWMPDDFKKSMESLATTYRNGWEEFKKYCEENAQRVKSFYAVAEKDPKKTTRKK